MKTQVVKIELLTEKILRFLLWTSMKEDKK